MKFHPILLIVLFSLACGDSSSAKKKSNTSTNNATSQTLGTTPTSSTNNNSTNNQTVNGTTNGGTTNNGTTNNNSTGTTNNGTTSNTTGTTNGVNKCPIAVAEGRAENGAVWASTFDADVTTTVDLRSLSTDPDGTIQLYKWAMISRPINSSARLEREMSESPILFVDLIGTYVVELTVADNEGKESCAPARVTIQVAPKQSFLVQLTWDTPADPDQTDANGTDLDLHYRQATSAWNQAPFSIFWDNKTNDWGVVGNSDDPELTLEDVNGAGPEIVVHDSPENMDYDIGVHYYADNAFGPSYATIRIFMNGIAVSEYKDQFLEANTFWTVATVNWPTKQISTVNTFQSGIPQN